MSNPAGTVYCMNCRADVPAPHDPCPSFDAWNLVHLPNVRHLGSVTYKTMRHPRKLLLAGKGLNWHIN